MTREERNRIELQRIDREIRMLRVRALQIVEDTPGVSELFVVDDIVVETARRTIRAAVRHLTGKDIE